MNEILLAIGGLIAALWGAGHLFPTRNVVTGFGPLSDDNRYIIMMEWIAEGMTLIFLGVLVLAVTLTGDSGESLATLVYIAVVLMLGALAVLSAFTGARTSILPMRLCPYIKSTAAVLILVGAVV
ncbi:MAG: hypothetical protein JXQ72_13515 [Anaerolineae bacterium]|nr:hypothetical protein [Anaerolineae bacterium]